MHVDTASETHHGASGSGPMNSVSDRISTLTKDEQLDLVMLSNELDVNTIRLRDIRKRIERPNTTPNTLANLVEREQSYLATRKRIFTDMNAIGARVGINFTDNEGDHGVPPPTTA